MDISEIIQQNALPGGQKVNKDIMGKDDFLKIMMLQLQNQDPLNPMDNEAMTAQLAQFSSLEQMTNLNENFLNAQAVNSFTNATQLLGKIVELPDPNSSPENPSTLATRVTAVSFTTEGPQLTLENGMLTSLEDVLRVAEPVQSIQ